MEEAGDPGPSLVEVEQRLVALGSAQGARQLVAVARTRLLGLVETVETWSTKNQLGNKALQTLLDSAHQTKDTLTRIDRPIRICLAGGPGTQKTFLANKLAAPPSILQRHGLPLHQHGLWPLLSRAQFDSLTQTTQEIHFDPALECIEVEPRVDQMVDGTGERVLVAPDRLAPEKIANIVESFKLKWGIRLEMVLVHLPWAGHAVIIDTPGFTEVRASKEQGGLLDAMGTCDVLVMGAMRGLGKAALQPYVDRSACSRHYNESAHYVVVQTFLSDPKIMLRDWDRASTTLADFFSDVGQDPDITLPPTLQLRYHSKNEYFSELASHAMSLPRNILDVAVFGAEGVDVTTERLLGALRDRVCLRQYETLFTSVCRCCLYLDTVVGWSTGNGNVPMELERRQQKGLGQASAHFTDRISKIAHQHPPPNNPWLDPLLDAVEVGPEETTRVLLALIGAHIRTLSLEANVLLDAYCMSVAESCLGVSGGGLLKHAVRCVGDPRAVLCVEVESGTIAAEIQNALAGSDRQLEDMQIAASEYFESVVEWCETKVIEWAKNVTAEVSAIVTNSRVALSKVSPEHMMEVCPGLEDSYGNLMETISALVDERQQQAAQEAEGGGSPSSPQLQSMTTEAAMATFKAVCCQPNTPDPPSCHRWCTHTPTPLPSPPPTNLVLLDDGWKPTTWDPTHLPTLQLHTSAESSRHTETHMSSALWMLLQNYEGPAPVFTVGWWDESVPIASLLPEWLCKEDCPPVFLCLTVSQVEGLRTFLHTHHGSMACRVILVSLCKPLDLGQCCAGLCSVLLQAGVHAIAWRDQGSTEAKVLAHDRMTVHAVSEERLYRTLDTSYTQLHTHLHCFVAGLFREHQQEIVYLLMDDPLLLAGIDTAASLRAVLKDLRNATTSMSSRRYWRETLRPGLAGILQLPCGGLAGLKAQLQWACTVDTRLAAVVLYSAPSRFKDGALLVNTALGAYPSPFLFALRCGPQQPEGFFLTDTSMLASLSPSLCGESGYLFRPESCSRPGPVLQQTVSSFRQRYLDTLAASHCGHLLYATAVLKHTSAPTCAPIAPPAKRSNPKIHHGNRQPEMKSLQDKIIIRKLSTPEATAQGDRDTVPVSSHPQEVSNRRSVRIQIQMNKMKLDVEETTRTTKTESENIKRVSESILFLRPCKFDRDNGERFHRDTKQTARFGTSMRMLVEHVEARTQATARRGKGVAAEARNISKKGEKTAVTRGKKRPGHHLADSDTAQHTAQAPTTPMRPKKVPRFKQPVTTVEIQPLFAHVPIPGKDVLPDAAETIESYLFRICAEHTKSPPNNITQVALHCALRLAGWQFTDRHFPHLAVDLPHSVRDKLFLLCKPSMIAVYWGLDDLVSGGYLPPFVGNIFFRFLDSTQDVGVMKRALTSLSQFLKNDTGKNGGSWEDLLRALPMPWAGALLERVIDRHAVAEKGVHMEFAAALLGHPWCRWAEPPTTVFLPAFWQRDLPALLCYMFIESGRHLPIITPLFSGDVSPFTILPTPTESLQDYLLRAISTKGDISSVLSLVAIGRALALIHWDPHLNNSPILHIPTDVRLKLGQLPVFQAMAAHRVLNDLCADGFLPRFVACVLFDHLSLEFSNWGVDVGGVLFAYFRVCSGAPKIYWLTLLHRLLTSLPGEWRWVGQLMDAVKANRQGQACYQATGKLYGGVLGADPWPRWTRECAKYDTTLMTSACTPPAVPYALRSKNPHPSSLHTCDKSIEGDAFGLTGGIMDYWGAVLSSQSLNVHATCGRLEVEGAVIVRM